MSNADDIFWRQFGAILVGLTIFGIVVAFIARSIAGDAHREAINNPVAIAERIAPAGTVRVGDPAATVAAAPSAPVAVQAAAPAAAAAVDGESVYNGACVACHAAGVAGAPKLDDDAAWAPRIALGEDALVASVVNGKGAMPANGGNPSLSEEQIRAAVLFMIGKPAGAADAKASAGNADAPATTVAAATSAAADAGKEMAAAGADKASEAATAAADSAKDMAAAGADTAKEAAAAAAPAATASAGKPGDEVYNLGCVACHATGVANAPKLTDKAAWEGRVAAGVDALIASAIKGKGAMPPKGGLMTLSDDDIGNAVRYMLEQAGVAAGG